MTPPLVVEQKMPITVFVRQGNFRYHEEPA